MSGVNPYWLQGLGSGFGQSLGGGDITQIANLLAGGDESDGPSLLQSLSAAFNGPLGAGLVVDALGGVVKGLFGGPDWKDVKAEEAGLRGELGKDVVNPAKAASFATRGVLQSGRGMAKVLSRRFGPEARGELYSKQLGNIADIYGQAYSSNAVAKSERDRMIRMSLLESAHRRM